MKMDGQQRNKKGKEANEQGKKMIVAIGLLEAEELGRVKTVTDKMTTKGLQITGVENDKITFRMQQDNMDGIGNELDSMRRMQFVRDVNLLYYSIERIKC
jgi:nitrate reductase NapAB chaperone NapD